MDDVIECRDCTPVTATKDGHTATAIRYCPVHKAESVVRRTAALADNPDLAALYERFGISVA